MERPARSTSNTSCDTERRVSELEQRGRGAGGRWVGEGWGLGSEQKKEEADASVSFLFLLFLFTSDSRLIFSLFSSLFAFATSPDLSSSWWPAELKKLLLLRLFKYNKHRAPLFFYYKYRCGFY